MKLQKTALALGIAVILNAILFFAGVVLFGRPAYSDFCEEYITQESCKIAGFQWNQDYDRCQVSRAHEASCREKFEQAWSRYDDLMLALRVTAGTIFMIVGLFTSLGGISSGFILGGLASITIGCREYWTWNHPNLKLIALSIALILLIFSGYKKLGSNKKTAD